ncbi:hypothetical protein J2S98_004547 [Arthrobacter oryzae]|nr:hypothetical protein [Arthrobacter oryzae]
MFGITRMALGYIICRRHLSARYGDTAVTDLAEARTLYAMTVLISR